MKTIVVTGGAGFIGANLVYYLLANAKDHRVVVFDKLTYAGNKPSLKDALLDRRVEFIRGDIADARAVQALYRRFKPDLLFNLAAESHVDRSIDGAVNFVRTNLVGTFQLLEATRKHLVGLKGKGFRFLHVSTDEVYGSLGNKGNFSEKSPYAPNSPYAATKAGSDHLVRAFYKTYGVPVVMTNCSNNYGPFQFPEKLIPLTILNAIEGKSLPIYGDGGNVRDWLYVEDHCSALWTVMRRGRIGEKYNVGGNMEKTNLGVVRNVCRELERVLPARKNPHFARRGISRYEDLIAFVPDRPGHDRRYAIDAAKVRKELGWKPSHSFDSGVRKTVQWYISNLDWCESVQAGKSGRRRLGLLHLTSLKGKA